MKLLMIVLVAVVLVVPAYCGVTSLRQQHHVSGVGYYGEEYDLTDTVPISGSASGVGSSAGNFLVSAYESAERGHASANSTYIFTIEQPILEISLNGYLRSEAEPAGHIGYSLSDYTTGGVIGSQSWSLSYENGYWLGSSWEGPFRRRISQTMSFALIVDHEYAINLSADSGNFDGSSVNLAVVLIPEPASILLMGLGVLLTSRKLNSRYVHKNLK